MPFMDHGAVESIVVNTVFIYAVVLHISFMCEFDTFMLFHCVVLFQCHYTCTLMGPRSAVVLFHARGVHIR